MKRDLSLVRSILLRCESANAGETLQTEDFQELQSDRDLIAGHIGIMVEAGLLKAADASNQDGEDYIIHRITWAGHEFLDSVRDEGVWEKAKGRIMKEGASWTFDLVKEVGKQILKEQLGLPA